MFQADANDRKLSAFHHWDKVDSVVDEASVVPAFFCLPTSDYSSNAPVVANFDGEKSFTADTCRMVTIQSQVPLQLLKLKVSRCWN